MVDQQPAEAAARRQAAMDSVEGGKADLAKAKAELEALNKQAAAAAATVRTPGKEPTLQPAGLDAGLRKAGATVDVKGTFSAAAVGGLKSDSVTDAVKELVKEQKRQVEETIKMRKTIELTGRLA